METILDNDHTYINHIFKHKKTDPGYDWLRNQIIYKILNFLFTEISSIDNTRDKHPDDKKVL